VNRPTAARAAGLHGVPALFVRAHGAGAVPERVRSERDTADAVAEAALDATYGFCLDAVDRLDAALGLTRGATPR
ncbi:MAG: hypothetical protein ACR2NB_08855, partial [Solirubrobacteraceae bacterium]